MASLNKYNGAWNASLAAHLFRRTTYGVTYETMKLYGSKSLDACLDILFQPLGPPSPPVNISFENDPDVPIGATWVDKGVSQNVKR